MIHKILLMLLSVSWATAQTKESFDDFLVNYQETIFRSDAERNEAIARWEGVETWQGFNLVVGELLRNEGGHRRMHSFYILKRLQLAPDEMVDRLLAGAKIALEEPSSLPPHLGILDKFPQDDRIIDWLAGLLSDRRKVPDPPKARGEDRSGGETARVCDCASGTITRMLIDRKQIPYDGLGVGSPTLEYQYTKRDRYNLSLARKLNELGFHVKEPTLTTETSSPRPEKVNVEGRKDPTKDSGINSLASDTETSKKHETLHWVLWSGAGIACLALTLLTLLRVLKSK